MILSGLITTYQYQNEISKEEFTNKLNEYLFRESHEEFSKGLTSSSFDLNFDEIGDDNIHTLISEIYNHFQGEKDENIIFNDMKSASYTHTEYVGFNGSNEFTYHWGNVSVELYDVTFNCTVSDEFYSVNIAKNLFEKIGFEKVSFAVTSLEV